MANAVYPNFKEALLDGSANTDLSGANVSVALVDLATYTYDAAHTFLTDLTGTVGTAVTVSGKTFTDGVFDHNDDVFSAVTGPTVEALVYYVDTGTAGTSRLIAYFDTGVNNLPATPNGGDLNLTVNASGVFAL